MNQNPDSFRAIFRYSSALLPTSLDLGQSKQPFFAAVLFSRFNVALIGY